MNVVHINTHDFGGASIAAYRLHRMLLAQGIDSSFLVLYKYSEIDDIEKFDTSPLEFLARKLGRKLGLDYGFGAEVDINIEVFSEFETIYDLRRSRLVRRADIVHLHWVANFIDYKTFFNWLKKPIVWTFHDLNPVMGGMHYTMYLKMASERLLKLERLYSWKKKEALRKAKIHVISPSNYVASFALESDFGFKSVAVIPNPVPEEVFFYKDKNLARQSLAYAEGDFIFLAVFSTVSNFRKGFSHVRAAAIHFSGMPNVRFHVIGSASDRVDYEQPNIFFLGSIGNSTELASNYASANATIMTSHEDNLPNVMVEALCCGCPVIGFHVGGIGEEIENEINGMLTNDFTDQGIIELIYRFMAVDDQFARSQISKSALSKFGKGKVVPRVLEVYKSALE